MGLRYAASLRTADSALGRARRAAAALIGATVGALRRALATIATLAVLVCGEVRRRPTAAGAAELWGSHASLEAASVARDRRSRSPPE